MNSKYYELHSQVEILLDNLISQKKDVTVDRNTAIKHITEENEWRVERLTEEVNTLDRVIRMVQDMLNRFPDGK